VDLLAGLAFGVEVSQVQQQHRENRNHDANSACNACPKNKVGRAVLVNFLVEEKFGD
jgi:hypothetical protein